MPAGGQVARYRQVFGLSDETAVTDEQVRHHWQLESALSQELRASAPASRWETFERCYDRLYSELPWLVGTGGKANPGLWIGLIGSRDAREYEVGSRAGELAIGLAQAGFEVTATDVSHQRGNRAARSHLTWAATDGVHLDQFAAPGSFDAVISNQLIEHLHPDDLEAHLSSALALLRPAWALRDGHSARVDRAPRRQQGVRLDASGGMHLHEYTNREMVRALRRAGFRRTRSVLHSPRILPEAHPSRLHLALMLAVEALLAPLGNARARSLARRLRGPLRLDVFLVAERAT